MAYFHCLIGGGSSGGGYELTVTCDADFAGTTITCTDGVTTLTQTCPSASPYEVVFEIPNGGDWTISGVVGGHTVSTGVNIPTSASLIATVQQTVTIHSAKEDTISYTDIDGATQTITFASGETSKQVTIEIDSGGSSITFTSSVAKNPSNLSNDYSKTVTVDENTTDVYVMPDNALYWYGNTCDWLTGGEGLASWVAGTGSTANGVANTNSYSCGGTNTTNKGFGTANKIDITDFDDLKCLVTANNPAWAATYSIMQASINKTTCTNVDANPPLPAPAMALTTGINTLDISSYSGDYAIGVYCFHTNTLTFTALWLE